MKLATLAAAIAVCLALGASTTTRADVAVERPAPTAPPAEESAPWWVWLLPPAGLVLGLGLGARFRAATHRGGPPKAARR